MRESHYYSYFPQMMAISMQVYSKSLVDDFSWAEMLAGKIDTKILDLGPSLLSLVSCNGAASVWNRVIGRLSHFDHFLINDSVNIEPEYKSRGFIIGLLVQGGIIPGEQTILNDISELKYPSNLSGIAATKIESSNSVVRARIPSQTFKLDGGNIFLKYVIFGTVFGCIFSYRNIKLNY